MKVKGNHPLGELLAAKLFSIETVPPKEQRRMVSRAIKAAIAWHENEIKGPCNTQMQRRPVESNDITITDMDLYNTGLGYPTR